MPLYFRLELEPEVFSSQILSSMCYRGILLLITLNPPDESDLQIDK